MPEPKQPRWPRIVVTPDDAMIDVTRRIELRGYRRHDALYDIEARITDTKSQPMKLEHDRPLAPGEPLHRDQIAHPICKLLRVFAKLLHHS